MCYIRIIITPINRSPTDPDNRTTIDLIKFANRDVEVSVCFPSSLQLYNISSTKSVIQRLLTAKNKELIKKLEDPSEIPGIISNFCPENVLSAKIFTVIIIEIEVSIGER